MPDFTRLNTPPRHEGIGARVAYEGAVWTTMRPPAGPAYCLTDRDPRTGLRP